MSIASRKSVELAKSPTGIRGLDVITEGGLPRSRPTLICGAAGSGKTLMAMEFLYRGATRFGEPGVFVCFEETEEELAANMSSLGWDLEQLVQDGKLVIEHVFIEPSLIQETGAYDLGGLLLRIEMAIQSVGAKRIALDTLEAVFGGFSDAGTIRAEVRRLFRWLKDHDVTAVVTAESGDDQLTRTGIEEYVSDCVMSLSHRMNDQIATRRIHVDKFRGSRHGTNEYPFLIAEDGIAILPITALALEYESSTERVPSGIERLDAMLGGEGFFRGSSVLVSGTAGTGKSTVAASFAEATCRQGKRCLYFAFEEAPSQIVRNMKSCGIELAPWLEKDVLRIHANRATRCGLELHLAVMHREVEVFKPAAVIVDPISNLSAVASAGDVKNMLTKLVDLFKGAAITSLFTDLTIGGKPLEASATAISSLMDTWLLLRDVESRGERNRTMYVLKSRGMAHSNQMREYRITGNGISLVDVYVGPTGVLTGSARISQEAKEEADRRLRREDIVRKRALLERRRATVQSQIAALQMELAAEQQALERELTEAEEREAVITANRRRMAQLRGAEDSADSALETPRSEGEQ